MATISPASPGTSLGRRLALMRERVLPPGAVLKTKLVWSRCDSHILSDPCTFKGNMLICGHCWDERKETGDVVIHGPLESPLAVVCETCGGKNAEVTGYGEASGTEFSKRRSGNLYYSTTTKKLEVEPLSTEAERQKEADRLQKEADAARKEMDKINRELDRQERNR